jgi:hypothetical protein
MIERFGHRLPAEAVTLQGGPVGEYCKMYRRGIEARELQPAVEIGLAACVASRGSLARRFKIFHDRCPRLRRPYVDDPPRLTVADRRRQVGKPQEPLDEIVRNGVRAKAPDIAPPTDKLLKRGSAVGLQRIVIGRGIGHRRNALRSKHRPSGVDDL